MLYKQKDLVDKVAAEAGYYKMAVKEILDATGKVITQMLTEGTEEDPTIIRVWEGLKFETRYFKPKIATKPKTGEKVMTEGHIFPFAVFKQNYRWKIRQACKNKELGLDETFDEDGIEDRED